MDYTKGTRRGKGNRKVDNTKLTRSGIVDTSTERKYGIAGREGMSSKIEDHLKDLTPLRRVSNR